MQSMNFASIIADIATLGLFFLFAFICAKKGFCKCIMPIVVVVLSFASAIFGSNVLEEPVSELIYPLINVKLEEKLADMVLEIQGQSGILGLVLGQIDFSNGVSKVARALTSDIVHIGLFIVILLLSIIIFSLLGKVATKMADLPLIKTLDGFFGCVYGLLECFVLLFITIKLCNALNVDFFAKYSAGTHILLWIFNL